MKEVVVEHAELNGSPVRVEDLGTIALLNYGHFTSMQVRGGRVRGLDLHLDPPGPAHRRHPGSSSAARSTES